MGKISIIVLHKPWWCMLSTIPCMQCLIVCEVRHLKIFVISLKYFVFCLLSCFICCPGCSSLCLLEVNVNITKILFQCHLCFFYCVDWLFFDARKWVLSFEILSLTVITMTLLFLFTTFLNIYFEIAAILQISFRFLDCFGCWSLIHCQSFLLLPYTINKTD